MITNVPLIMCFLFYESADIMTKSRDAKFFQRLNEVLVNAAVFLDHLTSWYCEI